MQACILGLGDSPAVPMIVQFVTGMGMRGGNGRREPVTVSAFAFAICGNYRMRERMRQKSGTGKSYRLAQGSYELAELGFDSRNS